MTTPNAPQRLAVRWPRWFLQVSSLKITLVCLLLSMALVTAGTLAQSRMGSFAAQKIFFNSWFLYWHIGKTAIPVAPGGLLIGALWFINLSATFVTRFRFTREALGLNISHAGVLVMLLGQFLTQGLSRETQMPLEIGQSGNYSQSSLKSELVVIKTSEPDFDIVTSIPESRFSHEGKIHLPRLPFYFVIRRFMRNAQLGMAQGQEASLATRGIGTQVTAHEMPPVSSDEETNNVTAFVEVREGEKSLGVWLVSSALGAPQTFSIKGEDYRLAIRQKRHYFPFTVTLKEFHHDRYPGTDIPKNFSSLVQITHPDKKESRTALIYMNHPLRYEGHTFYQASFGEGDRVSIFQVVENPFAPAPYVACAMISGGLLIYFMVHLVRFIKRRS